MILIFPAFVVIFLICYNADNIQNSIDEFFNGED